MNITKKIIITDTNIITDLSNANILEKYVNLNNVYISDMVKSDEINYKTGNILIINNFKTIKASTEQITELVQIAKNTKGLSQFDIINYIIARDNDAILATGDQKLKNYAESNNVEVIRTLKIIELMEKNKIISKEETINACNSLLNNENTRIPKEDLKATIKKYKVDLVA